MNVPLLFRVSVPLLTPVATVNVNVTPSVLMSFSPTFAFNVPFITTA